MKKLSFIKTNENDLLFYWTNDSLEQSFEKAFYWTNDFVKHIKKI